MSRSPRRALAALCAATALALTTPLAAATPAAATTTASTHYSGTLQDGATWIADKPARWNGVLLVFSHGFGALTAANAPSDAVRDRLLAEGYALAGSSYDPNGSAWALNSAERDQFATITAFGDTAGRPTHVVSVGLSMGGLVNAQIARDGAGRIDGALNLCGLVAGGVDLEDYQLDAEYALAWFFDRADLPNLVNLSDPSAASALAHRLSTAVDAAQQTPAGRARISLAAAYLNQSAWAPGQAPPAPADYADQEYQQYQWLQQGLLYFIVPGRYAVEQSAGGNPSSTKGVDYTDLLNKSWHADEVRALYAAAGLDLKADTAALTAHADISGSATARANLNASSTVTSLGIPMLSLHTTSDQLVPVEQENAYAARIRAAGDNRLLRQAFVARQGHCNFTTAEIVAGLHALEQRLVTGAWSDVATPESLQERATALDLGGAAFVDWKPSRLSGVR
ncbi:alpha/beta hydrolase [Kitasatospora phosalacinea]|uniref:Alpha/beta hydrolase n=1 Tax=Kitasatospora phosalacinea TaxID=2065 RepID=A0A9W6QCT6_9ACTN|nr:alpha/beta hydrolase [Kitasatospora phosalacinea]GLW73799.1 alpha/beta hydrolase [Kitasatospora phosalacinea]